MSHSDSKTVVIAALIGNSLIAITKFCAAFFTSSSAMLSEGIHSVVDVGNQFLLLFGMNRAGKKATKDHPFGFGKEIYFYSFIVAILLFSFGGGISIYEGIKQFSHPEPISNVYINYIVLGFAFIFEGCAWYVAFKEFKKSTKHFHWFHSVNRAKDPAMIVVLLEDSAAMLGLIVAFIGITASHFFKMPMLDAVASIIIGCLLVIVAIWLAYESKSLLIGESADPELVEKISHIISNTDGIEAIQNILTMHMGPYEVLVNLHVDFAASLNSTEVETIIANIESQIKDQVKEVKWIFIAAKSLNFR